MNVEELSSSMIMASFVRQSRTNRESQLMPICCTLECYGINQLPFNPNVVYFSDENHMDLAFEACQKALEENILLWTAIITYLRFGGEELPKIFDRHRDKS